MEFIQQGGLMMWPLLAISLFACAIIIERCLFFSSIASLSLSELSLSDFEASSKKDENTACSPLEYYIVQHQFLASSLIQKYKQILLSAESISLKEAYLYNEGQAILAKCNYGLDMLSTIVRCAPLMGLLGTVIGMIDTFSNLEMQQSGIDLGMLAGGIWQALITTATGLVIAIIALLAHQYFISRKKNIMESLEGLARISLACDNDKYSAM